MFGVYGYKQETVTDKSSKHYGRKVYTEKGLPVKNNELQYLGDATPEFTMGISNKVRFRNFTLNALLDWRHGGVTYSGITKYMDAGGYNQHTLKLRDEGIIGDGVVLQSDGTYKENTTKLSGDDIKGSYISAYKNINDNYIYDASYLKLRELSLAFDLPKHLLEKTPFEALKLSLVGRNLFLISDVPNTDPDTYHDGVPGNSGEFYTSSTRSYGISANIKF